MVTANTLLDYQDAAEYLNDSLRHIRYLWQTRQIAGVKVGRRVRFRQEDLDAYVLRNRIEAVEVTAA